MKQLSPEDFNRLWETSRTCIFRLEQYRYYQVLSDLQVFRRHQRGERIRSSELLPDWYASIARKVSSGVRVDRVRVFDLPLPDYQKYEIDWGYAVGAKYGQATWAMRRELYDDLRRVYNRSATDFWLFDKTTVLIAYTEDIDYIGLYLPDSDQETTEWVRFGQALLGRAFALSDFCTAHGIEPSIDRIDWDVLPPNVEPIP